MKYISQKGWCFQIKLLIRNSYFIVILFIFFLTSNIFSAVSVRTSVSESPLNITLTWDSSGKDVNIFRRILGQEDFATWTLITTVIGSTNTFSDNKILEGVAYEYKLATVIDVYNTGYIVSGVNVPIVEDRGTLLLVVDNTVVTSLSAELVRLEQDLRGDGWTVIRYNLARHGSGTPESLKAWVKTQYTANPSKVTSLFLFGHLPICMSGFEAPDGHNNVAHPTDLFYADMDGVWTDTGTFINNSNDLTIKSNLPGDGMYDQNYIPGNKRVEIQVGRVDLSGMPAFNSSEIELLRNYLNKDHNFRHGITKTRLNGVSGNSYLPMESNCVNSLMGYSNVFNGTFDNLTASTYTWAVDFGTPNGIYYPAFKYKSTFYINFGSYKQRFETTNNPMRALLCLPEYGLTCAWGSRPFWYFHQMGLGKTIGYCALRTQNNGESDYVPACSYWFQGSIWNNLMGDPTLRMHIVTPPSNLKSVMNGGNVNLSWKASPDANIGYHIYSSTSETGIYTRITTTPIVATSYTDVSTGATTFYRIHAVKLEQSTSGSYYNLSQGVYIQNPTTGWVDTIAPTVPTQLTAFNKTVDSFTFSWTPSTDNLSVPTYEIFKDGISIATTPNNTFVVNYTPGSTCFDMSVRAVDNVGNVSSISLQLNVVISSIVNPSANLISNPNFDINTVGWNLFVTNSALATMESIPQSGYDFNVLKVNSTSLGARPTSSEKIQVRTNVFVEKDKTYAVRFKASADATRTIDLKVFQNISPDFNSALAVSNIQLTTTPTIFGPYLFSWRNTDSLAFCFNTSSSTSPIYLDDVKIVEVTGPAINIKDGLLNIIDNVGTLSYKSIYDFGSVDVNSSITKTFTIENNGSAPLLLTGSPKVLVTSATSNEFLLQSDPPTIIAAGTQATFQVKFTPTSLGVSSGINTISIETNDPSENPYNFKIFGTGIRKTALSEVEWNADSEISVYPNPVVGILNIDVHSDVGENIVLEIVDLHGQSLILQQRRMTYNVVNTVQMDIRNLTTGIYIIKITTNKGFRKTRMINVCS